MKRPLSARWPGALLFYAVQFTWGLPVNLVGFIVFLCCRGARRGVYRRSVVSFLPGGRGGLSLGVFTFVSAQDGDVLRLCSHEYGHTLQCLLLGPLYWPLIVLPSAVWYHLFGGFRKRRGIPYDWLYCERWATAWGKRRGGG